jgi:drug/metabolite transporter (DMT)-like permease
LVVCTITTNDGFADRHRATVVPRQNRPVTPPSGRRPSTAAIALALLIVYVVWGSTYLGIAVMIETLPPLLAAGSRYLIAGGVMIAAVTIHARLRGRRDEVRTTRVQWRAAFIVGTLLLLGGNGGVVLAEHWGVASGLAAIGTAVVPVWVALLAAFWGEPPTQLEWAGVVVGISGVLLLNLEEGFRASAGGAAAILIGGVCWALGSMLARRITMPAGMMSSAAQMLVGGAAFLAIGALIGERMTEMPTARSLGGLAYLVFGGALIGYSAYGYLLRTVRPALATSYSYVNPLVAVLLGVALAGERFSPAGALAMAVIICGVVLVVAGRSRRQEAAAAAPASRTPEAGEAASGAPRHS